MGSKSFWKVKGRLPCSLSIMETSGNRPWRYPSGFQRFLWIKKIFFLYQWKIWKTAGNFYGRFPVSSFQMIHHWRTTQYVILVSLFCRPIIKSISHFFGRPKENCTVSETRQFCFPTLLNFLENWLKYKKKKKCDFRKISTINLIPL